MEVAASQVPKVQSFLRDAFNRHPFHWNRPKHYTIYFLPPTGAYGSAGNAVCRIKIRAHVDSVFSLSTFDTTIIKPDALDDPVELEGKTYSLRGVILDVPWPISEALDILDDVKPIKKPPTDADGEVIKRLYHSADYK